LVHGFYGTCRTHGHKDGGLDGPMRRLNEPGPRRRLWVFMLDVE